LDEAAEGDVAVEAEGEEVNVADIAFVCEEFEARRSGLEK
jgi:hypothetical protein